MHVEAFHRVLKYIYLNGKQNKRVDHLVHILFKISRDKSFEQIQKSHKGKITHRVREMNKRHVQAEKMIKDDLKPATASETSDSWNVPSQTISEKTYIVGRLQHNCTACKIKCQKCGVCSKAYTCTCIDYAIHSTACKHIHCVCLTVQQQCEHSTKQPSTTQMSMDIDAVSTQQIQSEEATPTQSTQFETVKRNIQSKIFELQILSRSADSVSTLSAVLSHISSAVMVLQSNEKSLMCNKLPSSKQKTTLPPNLTIQMQRYHSTKKKKKREAPYSLSKPTTAESVKIRDKLQTYDVVVCSICYKEDDEGGRDEIQWIQCSTCKLWFHSNCVTLSEDAQLFMCDICCNRNPIS